MVTFNALQKVFRARFEDGRAHANLGQLADLGVDQPYLTAARPAYETLLGKTRTAANQINFFKKMRRGSESP